MEFKEFRRKYQGKCAMLSAGYATTYLYIKKVHFSQLGADFAFKCITDALFCFDNEKSRFIENDIWYLSDSLFDSGTFNIIKKSMYKDVLRHHLDEETIKTVFDY